MSCRLTLWCHILVWLLTIQESSSGTILWMSLLAFFFKPSKKKHVTSSMNGVVACSHRCSAKSLIIKFPFFFLSKVFAFQNIFWCFKNITFLISFLLFSFTNGRDASAMFHSPNASEYYSKRCRLLQC